MTDPEHSALDARSDDHPPETAAVAMAEAAEAEAAAAEAEARAAAARTRAIRLRLQAETPRAEGSDTCDAAPQRDSAVANADAATSARPRRRGRRPPMRKAVAVGAAVLLTCAALAASGYMVYRDHAVAQERQHAAEFAAAARQAVMTLMSLDFNKTQEDMQRIADMSTGNFKQHFPAFSEQLAKGLEQSKVVTTVKVSDVAVESMTDRSAVVLVAATTDVNNPGTAHEPRSWHITLGLVVKDGQPKVSNVEFFQ